MNSRALAGIVAGAALFGACSSEPVATSGGVGGASSSSSASGASSSSSSTGAVAASSSSSGLPPTFDVSGVVVDQDGEPLEGAWVLQGGAQKPALTTGKDGAFKLTITTSIPGTPAVVATKEGYRTGGVELDPVPDAPVTIVEHYVTPPDNPTYVYGDPGTGDKGHDNNTSYCGHCHTTFVKQADASAHGKSASDPWLWDQFKGISEAFKDAASCKAAGGEWKSGEVPGAPIATDPYCYVGASVLTDLNPGCGGKGAPACDDPASPVQPTVFGGCADCHAAAMRPTAKTSDASLFWAETLTYERGTHCDFCHHIQSVDLQAPAGIAGQIKLQRSRDKLNPNDPGSKLRSVVFGPLLDVANEFVGSSYSPLFETSDVCGPCHLQNQPALVPGTKLDATRWPSGLPVHSTYSEWAEGPFAKQGGKTCQDCHMPPDDTGMTNSVDVTTPDLASITFGFAHPSELVRKHTFRGPLDVDKTRLVDDAIALDVALGAAGGDVTATITITNTQGGHAIPTGEPMRALVLVVTTDACGAAMKPSGGMTIFDAGGELARGVLGADASLAGATLTWPSGAAIAKAGDVVRFVRPTGTFDDYAGIGFFASPALTPQQKGLELQAPIGEAVVVSAQNGALILSGAPSVQAGDVALLGDALPASLADGAPALALAGAPGYAFARVTVDADGARNVAHYRANDLASDNRLSPTTPATTTHAFAVPNGCKAANVTATLLYRPAPVVEGRLRGWDPRDWVVAKKTAMIALP